MIRFTVIILRLIFKSYVAFSIDYAYFPITLLPFCQNILLFTFLNYITNGVNKSKTDYKMNVE